ncbi:NAD-dependent epimerase/dehydratase family protein [Frigoribacterium sp. CFBP9039]|uniref:NAD-dependent epimerase/dehydratase family protein n=1 Tax=unclassified Frigoribacterium TaxID=2627005 RepID=UPI0017816214|nr:MULTISPECIES: NAD-dependent epimerase/dehydratase family protein [unclassified Frigoribacterium]MBD8703849.1 NAD-dependent epimerase/dehydratase family protein [Frigoribacterium sp. CFBP 13712]MDY0946318.1 NAD-dependent epimerase/dehydratase family protein [Frigoribacterium sp. CFBP9039]
MRVVVVGATGNLGTALLRRLQAEPRVTELAGVARRGPRSASPPYGDVTWFGIDIGDDAAPEQLAAAFAGADAVVHLGWALQPSHDRDAMYRTNVTGTSHVLDAVVRARVPHVLIASSVGAYSRGPKGRRVDESYKTRGVRHSSYSSYKATNESVLDGFSRQHPDVVVTRMRPGLVFQAAAAREIVGLFAGRWVPTTWLSRFRPPFLPLSPRFVSQVVHADDVADAFWRAIDRRAGGAFNLAAEPLVDSYSIAEAFGSRVVPVPYRVLRTAALVTWLLRLQPTEPGWLDIAAKIPAMSTEKARRELGWAPTRTADETLREFVGGLAAGTSNEASHPLSG